MKETVIFPGQGSQYVGMGSDIYDNFPAAKDIFKRADTFLGYDISRLCFQGPADELKDTLHQQLAIFVVSAACLEVFRSKKASQPLFYAGLSLGEYACVYAAGVLSLEDVLLLVRERAVAMAQSAAESASCMYAVLGLEKEALEEDNGKLFYIANLNCPSQVVISLKNDDKDSVRSLLEQKGAKKIIELEVSGGFHSVFMKSAQGRLQAVADSLSFRDAQMPIVSNIDAKPHVDAFRIKQNLVQQLTEPVLWWKSMEFLRLEGVSLFFEVGPSKVLKGLMRKIDSSLKVTSCGKAEDFKNIDEEKIHIY